MCANHLDEAQTPSCLGSVEGSCQRLLRVRAGAWSRAHRRKARNMLEAVIMAPCLSPTGVRAVSGSSPCGMTSEHFPVIKQHTRNWFVSFPT
ncbi:hypothetical protein PoB_000053200 [Plakobranchus ocellatus]|uniref:Uncharacterized protein n=1 Tax=Plakobranchus ocellatus TaxID=259542 RepID=A0AAV3XU26_9GAST|nr:hypothetical protein PoB_000053200 [Plakobranchus ocellatus]